MHYVASIKILLCGSLLSSKKVVVNFTNILRAAFPLRWLPCNVQKSWSFGFCTKNVGEIETRTNIDFTSFIGLTPFSKQMTGNRSICVVLRQKCLNLVYVQKSCSFGFCTKKCSFIELAPFSKKWRATGLNLIKLLGAYLSV